MFDESGEANFTARIANLAAMKADEAKTICRRKIEAVASTTDQLNHTAEEASVFKPWCAAVRENYQRLKGELAAVGATWNPVETPDQETYDAKDIGYNEALAAIDIHAGWPEWTGYLLDQAVASDADLAPEQQVFSHPSAGVDPIDVARAINARLLHKDDDLNPQAPSDWDMDGQGVVEAMPAVSNVPPEIAALLDEGETLTRDVRRKLTERLNVELAELKNLRGLAGEDLKREAEIEKLLGLFARLGEI